LTLVTGGREEFCFLFGSSDGKRANSQLTLAARRLGATVGE
jgi:hypothetical protein